MSRQDHIKVSTDLLQKITSEQAWHYSIIPGYDNGQEMKLFISEDKARNPGIKDELEVLLGKQLTLEPADPQLIFKSLGRHYRRGRKQGQTAVKTGGLKSEDFLLDLIEEANNVGSSDIHMEAYEDSCRIRMRIDGKLSERYIIEKEEYPALINKIKIMGNLDIAEKRLPQDGRIFFKRHKDKFDIRVSVLPALYGEKVVMRLLSKDATSIDIESLGFNAAQIDDYTMGIKKPHGIILISGPTGSGKTTTLYATLKILNREETNILTIEDPIEYTLAGINQVQLKETIGLTFASALRTFLRQDPDIIMLGEIRDSETAQMAVRAALTGHLVLSTIHTNSAMGTITRLMDMGVPSFLVANTLVLSVAQRLIRLLCPHCKKATPFDEGLYPGNFSPPAKVTEHFLPVGCEHCYYTGYRGRKAIYEVIPVNRVLANHIKEGNFNPDEIMKNEEIKSLADCAFADFKAGNTSLEEIFPVLIER